jgi:hypothetical protein
MYMRTLEESPHWYRHRMMWLVIALPCSAVLACIATAVLIMQHPDVDVRTPQAKSTLVIHGHASNSVLPPGE